MSKRPMTIKVREDYAVDGGYAFIDLGRRIGTDTRFAMRRLEGEPPHLGPLGWQHEPAWLQPKQVDQAGASTVLRVGPEIVDHVAEFIHVELKTADGAVSSIVNWPAITRTAGRPLNVLGPEPKPPKPLSPEPGPRPGPGPDKSQPAPKPEITGDLVKEEQPRKPRRRGLILAISLIALIAIAAGLAYRDPDRIGHYRDAVVALIKPSPPPEGQVSAAEIKSQLDQLMRDQAPADQFVALGRRALEAGYGALAFEAFDQADFTKNPDAAFELGKFYDPRVTDPAHRGAAVANPERAASYYSRWKSVSSKHAEQLRGLCATVTAEAATNASLKKLCQ